MYLVYGESAVYGVAIVLIKDTMNIHIVVDYLITGGGGGVKGVFL